MAIAKVAAQGCQTDRCLVQELFAFVAAVLQHFDERGTTTVVTRSEGFVSLRSLRLWLHEATPHDCKSLRVFMTALAKRARPHIGVSTDQSICLLALK